MCTLYQTIRLFHMHTHAHAHLVVCLHMCVQLPGTPPRHRPAHGVPHDAATQALPPRVLPHHHVEQVATVGVVLGAEDKQ